MTKQTIRSTGSPRTKQDEFRLTLAVVCIHLIIIAFVIVGVKG